MNWGTPAYGATLPSSQLNEYALTMLKLWAKEDPVDLVTRTYPLFRRMEEAGSIERLPSGMELQDQFRYANPDRSTILTRTNGIKQRDEVPTEAYAGTRWDWLLALQTMTVSMYDKKSILKGNMGNFANLLNKKRRTAINAQNIFEVDTFWDGYSDEAGVNVFGLNDMIRFDNTADPSKGPLGGLAIATNPLWTNRSVNYNKVYKTVSSGYEVSSFLRDGTANSLLALYNDMRVKEDGSFPDLLPANQVAYDYCEDLVRQHLLYNSKTAAEELGIDAITYRGSDIFYDESVPDDPNTSTYGVIYLVNSKAVKLIYGEGEEHLWNPMYDGVKTASNWDYSTFMSTMCRDVTQLGVFYGLKPASVS